MTHLPHGTYFSEAHRFEEDSMYLLRHLGVPNSLESSERFVRRLMEKCIVALFHSYRESLRSRRPTMTKEKWLAVGRPTLEKIHADLKKLKARIPNAAKKNVWRPL